MESGSVQPQKRVCTTNKEKEILVLAAIAPNTENSSRQISREPGISQTSVIQILGGHTFYFYHISLYHELGRKDVENRVNFRDWALERFRGDNVEGSVSITCPIGVQKIQDDCDGGSPTPFFGERLV